MTTLIPIKQATNYQMVSTGDILELVTGEKVSFIEMKRTKWYGKLNGKGIIVPIFRDNETPYVKAIVGKDDSVIVNAVNPVEFKFGDLFYCDGHKETLMYISNRIKGKKRMVYARDLASAMMFNIGMDMKMIKIDLDKVKKETSNL